jgi:hypothetical protein
MSFIYTFAIKDLENERVMALFNDLDNEIAYLRARLRMLNFVVNKMPLSVKKARLIAVADKLLGQLYELVPSTKSADFFHVP